MERIIAPSVLSADFGNLNSEVEMLNNSKAEWIHFDVMDGTFVPNISFGLPVLESITKVSKGIQDAHLMIVNPDQFIVPFKEAGADILTVHYEACTHLHRTVQKIKAAGMKAGVAINPHTPVSVLEDILGDLDMVLIMCVNPGYGGQKFIDRSFTKIRKLRKMIDDNNLNTLIQVDGGVGVANAKQLFEAGVNVLVAGSAVFNSANPTETIAQMLA